MTKAYFLSDAHLGSLAFDDAMEKERRLVSFLDSIKDDATHVFFLGDMFDYWYEYKNVVPKGHVRFLGKVAELSDRGIEVHYLTGNHDIWLKDYFQKECGMKVHRDPFTISLDAKTFYLSHGDGQGDPSRMFRFMRSLFRSKTLQVLFSSIHPRWTVAFGQSWARHSRLKRENGREPDYMGEDKEYLVQFAKSFIKDHPKVFGLMFGHRHIELDLMLNRSQRMMILGDWINFFTYAVFDGENLEMRNWQED